MEYFVYMTNDCNLNCEYCSVLIDRTQNSIPLRPGDSNAELIHLIDQTQIIQNDSYVTVYFFGGEPSLEYHASIRMMRDMQRELNKYSLKFILHTNGLLLHKIPDELLEQLSAIVCSINYEKIPNHSLANSYFSQVLDNVILIKKRTNITIIGRMTITEKTSLYTELLQFSHFFDYIYWQIENTPNFIDYRNFYETYTYEMRITFSYWMQYLQNGILLKYVPFMAATRFLLFHDRPKTTFSCGYGSGMVYVQTDGACYACSDSIENGIHYIGSVTKGVNLPKPSLMAYRCAKCGFRPLCLGRCGRMHKEFTKKQISRYCALNKSMFKLFMSNKECLEFIIAAHPLLSDKFMESALDLTELTP
ncbi:MAG: radical SAM protein [Halodesulfovibrio sp.]